MYCFYTNWTRCDGLTSTHKYLEKLIATVDLVELVELGETTYVYLEIQAAVQHVNMKQLDLIYL